VPRFKRSERGEMPFLDHLEELRWRLIWSLGALAVGIVVGFILADQFDVLGLLKRPIAPYLPGGKLYFTGVAEPILITFKLAFVVGLVLASPVIIWQVWKFLSPALYEKERRIVLPVSIVGVFLFAAGAFLAYWLILPMAIKVLFGFQSESLRPIVTAKEYFGFAAQVVIAFGAIFELPLVLLILISLGVVSSSFLGRHRRIAIAANAFLAMLLAPADLVSMVLMMIPVQLFYEVSILIGRVLERRRAHRLAAAGEEVAAAGEA
jgi:sec-independent protein translocase protein TatC